MARVMRYFRHAIQLVPSQVSSLTNCKQIRYLTTTYQRIKQRKKELYTAAKTMQLENMAKEKNRDEHCRRIKRQAYKQETRLQSTLFVKYSDKNRKLSTIPTPVRYLPSEFVCNLQSKTLRLQNDKEYVMQNTQFNYLSNTVATKITSILRVVITKKRICKRKKEHVKNETPVKVTRISSHDSHIYIPIYKTCLNIITIIDKMHSSQREQTRRQCDIYLENQ